MIEEDKTSVEKLISHTEEYLKTKQELIKLVVAEKTSMVSSSLFSSFIIIGVFCMVIVFASIALAFVLAALFGGIMYGFLTVTGLYLIAGILLAANRKKWLEEPVMNMVIKNYFKNDHHDEN